MVICIFAKPPVPGQVKTRLAVALGPERAAALARAFLDDTIAAVRRLPRAQVALASTEPVPGDVPVLLQGEGDLGERIERVLRAALELAPFAIAIGADAPGLPPGLLEAARAALERADAVTARRTTAASICSACALAPRASSPICRGARRIRLCAPRNDCARTGCASKYSSRGSTSIVPKTWIGCAT